MIYNQLSLSRRKEVFLKRDKVFFVFGRKFTLQIISSPD